MRSARPRARRAAAAPARTRRATRRSRGARPRPRLSTSRMRSSRASSTVSAGSTMPAMPHMMAPLLRLRAAHADRLVEELDVPEAIGLKPPEYLGVEDLPLVLRRVPVEGVEPAPPPV